MAVRLQKSVNTGLTCGLSYTSALSVTYSADTAVVCGLWRYINAFCLCF